ncbi:MAG: aldose 1-epimerase family protein [Chitinophagales bacterium]|nr:aldose 1-epimerase family protein [Chitinophagales bacterium]
MHSIENSVLKVSAREYGAELISVFDKRTGIEHLWQADEKFWGWYAPVLFPVVGRCLNDEVTIDARKYAMEKHGFARKSNFGLLELSDLKMVFMLQSNDLTKKLYPFDFEFLIAYQLKQHSLVCSYEVINKSGRTMPFQLGGHPAFAVPFYANEKYEDYYIEFEQAEDLVRHYINSEGFFDGRTEAVLSGTNKLPLSKNMFANDAYIFKNLQSRAVTLKSDKHGQWLKVSFPQFNYLGLWAKPGAPYVCIEPWLGCADTAGKAVEFSEREAVQSLPAGETFGCSIVFEVEN